MTKQNLDMEKKANFLYDFFKLPFFHLPPLYRDSEKEGGLESVEKRGRKKKKTPTVAMAPEDYKKKRGIVHIRKTGL